MPLTLTALDMAYAAPDRETIDRVLASLDGGRVSLATLGRSDVDYVQVRGSRRDGFTLEYQEGSVARRYRSAERAHTLDDALRVFHRYAASDPSWLDGIAWRTEHIEEPEQRWTGTWLGFSVLVVVVAIIVWLFRGW